MPDRAARVLAALDEAQLNARGHLTFSSVDGVGLDLHGLGASRVTNAVGELGTPDSAEPVQAPEPSASP